MSPKRLQISAGTGPVEVRRFVARLATFLEARCSEMGASVTAIHTRGPEEAPPCVVLYLAESCAPLEGLAGTHVLVARSPERGKHARKRWFAAVSVLEDAVRREAVRTLRADEVVLTACRAGGPGGQHVNKTSSAVRAHHPASGLSVRVSDERSQHHNARIALERLATSLAELAEERVRRERAEERLRHYRVERGRPAFVYESAPDGGLRHAT